MANITITNNNAGGVILHEDFCSDETLSAGNGAVKAGTILARNIGTKKLALFVKGGTASINGTPAAVLTYAITVAAASTAIRVLQRGQVIKSALVIHADGDDSNIDAVVKGQLEDTGIDAVETTELNRLANQ